jgi:ribosomal protein L7/L12
MCNGDIAVSGNEAFATCDYCGAQVRFAQASPQNNLAQIPSNTYKLILLDAGSDKHQVIEVLCDMAIPIGLAEATKATEIIPSLVLSLEDAELVALEQMCLEEVGATVQLLQPGEPVHVNYVAI